MSFPYISECNFDDSTKGHFDVETDTESRLDIAHFSDLSRYPASTHGPLAPFRGAYCARVALANDGTPADAYFQETGSWDLSADGTIWFRFAFFLSNDTVMANNDEFAILQLWSGATTVEAGVYIKFTTSGGFTVGIGETSGTQTKPLTLGKWHIFELGCNIDAGGGNDGTIDGYLDNSAYTQVASLDQAVITSGVVGVMGQDAGTTTGILLLDNIIADDARLGYVPLARFGVQRTVTSAAEQIFVGPGTIDAAALLSTTSGNIMQLFDTDEAEVAAAQSFRVELAVGGFQSCEGPIEFRRGCYAVLSGTDPRGQVMITRAGDNRGGLLGPIYYNENGVRRWGMERRPRRV